MFQLASPPPPPKTDLLAAVNCMSVSSVPLYCFLAEFQWNFFFQNNIHDWVSYLTRSV